MLRSDKEKAEGEFNHKTGSGNRFKIKYKAAVIDIKDVPYNPEIQNLCYPGCKNYGKKKSCPPYAKKFEDLRGDYDIMLVFALIVDTEQAIRQFKKPPNYMGYLRPLDKTLRGIITKITRDVESKFSGYALLEGACGLCNKCRFKKDKVCNKPKEVRPSLEASGVNVAELTEKALNHTIQWYAKDMSKIPSKYFKHINKSNIHNSIDYLTKVTGMLLSDSLDRSKVIQYLVNRI